jgi:outer membrane immunogenic protein
VWPESHATQPKATIIRLSQPFGSSILYPSKKNGLGRIHEGRHMKKILLASVAVAALCSASAFAADMPVKAAPYDPGFNWSGCYVGLNAGYGWGKRRIDQFDTRVRGVDDGRFNFNADGFVGGAQWGCNWQSGKTVWGYESDFQGTTVRSRNVGQPFDAETAMNFNLPYFSTSRVRVGYAAWDRGLLYLTGGLAMGAVKYEANDLANNGTDYTQTKNRIGFAAGAGAEWALADPRWSVKVEYLFVDFGKKTYITNDPGFTTNVKSNTNIVRVGLNYKFDWGKGPVVAKY